MAAPEATDTTSLRIEAARIENSQTRAFVARAGGMSPATYSRRIQRNDWKIPEVGRIARALRRDPSSLFPPEFGELS